MNVAQLLTAAAQERPGHPAWIFEGRTFSYQEVDRLTDRFANALQALEVPAGGVIAMFLDSGPELAVAYLGALKAGVVPNVVNGSLKSEEVRLIVADSEAHVLLTNPGRFEALKPLRDQLGTRSIVLTGPPVLEPGALSYEKLLECSREGFEALDLPPGELASLLYTSGTTGQPKGVMLTHRNILDNAIQFGRIHYRPDDRLLIAAPLFHCWGLINGILGVFHVGATSILLRRFQTEPVLDLIERERPTVMLGVPAMYNYMTRSPSMDRRDVSSLRFVLSAAAPMPLELLDTVRGVWKVGYAESYGLTETSPVITTTSYTELRPGSCGRAMGDTELKVVDVHGNALPSGSVGELWARGTAISAGYFRRPEATAQVFTQDGWFKTGDIARIDQDGYVYIVDRLKDMINVAGEKVYPRDVEEVLLRHPAIADAVVLGVPDPDRGEAVKAYVVLKPHGSCSAEEVLEYLSPQLAGFKLPRSIAFLDSIPRSASGKALRRLLR